MLGARRSLARLMLAPLIGALILWLSDQLILWLARVWMEVSTGSVTALIGAPLLLWPLPRLRSISAPAMDAGDKVHAERQSVVWFSLAGLAVLVIASFAALAGTRRHGLALGDGDLLHELMQWRWPRIFSALIVGVMLAVAGCIIQRLTGNLDGKSPEVLGISSGAAFGVVLMLFLVPGNAFGWLMPAGEYRRGSHADDYSDRLRARGVLTSPYAAGRDAAQHRVYYAADDVAGEGDPRMAQILTWISGSTYNATGSQVVHTGIVMIVLLAIVPLCRRWMTILPLGGDTARSASC